MIASLSDKSSKARHGLLILLLLALALSACATTNSSNASSASNASNTQDTKPPVPPFKNILLFDKNGLPRDPTGKIDCKDTLIKEVSDKNDDKKDLDLTLCNSGEFPPGLLNAAVSFPPLKSKNQHPYKTYLDQIIKGIEASDKKKILIFIHGGLNSSEESLERVMKEIDCDPGPCKTRYQSILDTGYYPIFINWDTSLFTSYYDHLTRIRQGEVWSGIMGKIFAPVYLGVDLAYAIARMPVIWGSMILNNMKANEVLDTVPGAVNPRIAEEEIKIYPDDMDANQSKITRHIDVESTDRSDGERAKTAFTYAATLPVKAFVTDPLLGSFGPSAWNNMYRRARLLFDLDGDFHPTMDPCKPSGSFDFDCLSLINPKPDKKTGFIDQSKSVSITGFRNGGGGVSIFLDRLQSEIAQKDSKIKNKEITIIGHSMGTIVLNEMLRRFPNIRYQNIVYLAAACSIHDFQGSVLPYLASQKDANFYNVTLNQKTERRETNLEYLGLDISSRGSLLVWLDNFLTNPLSHLDRTAGRYDNFMPTVYAIPEGLRDKIHITAFGARKFENEYSGPQKHGDFSSEYRFWKPECWQTVGETNLKKEGCKVEERN